MSTSEINFQYMKTKQDSDSTENWSGDATLVTHAGRDSRDHFGAVNPAVYRASTILFPTVEAFSARRDQRVRYGTHGTPTAHALEDAMSALEGAAGTVLAPSGLAIISNVLLAFLSGGDHILVPDSVYGPVRSLCTKLLPRLGVTATFYPPRIGAGIDALVRPETRLIWLESPGSLTFEIQDVPAIVAVARARNIVTALDNSWSGSVFLKPLAIGVDISIQAATKYVSGHSDVLMGTAACNERSYKAVYDTGSLLGQCVGADDAYLALRGLRTIEVRLARQFESAMKVAEFLEGRPEVKAVFHPGLPSHPDHAIWKRDFTGASGLFGFALQAPPDAEDVRHRLSAMLDSMRFFGMGASWGGYESLLVPTYPEKLRTATGVEPGYQYMRIHVGLEAVADLVADLSAALDRWSGKA